MADSPAPKLPASQAVKIGIRNPQLLQRGDCVGVPSRRAIDPAGVISTDGEHVIDEDMMPACEREDGVDERVGRYAIGHRVKRLGVIQRGTAQQHPRRSHSAAAEKDVSDDVRQPARRSRRGLQRTNAAGVAQDAADRCPDAPVAFQDGDEALQKARLVAVVVIKHADVAPAAKRDRGGKGERRGRRPSAGPLVPAQLPANEQRRHRA